MLELGRTTGILGVTQSFVRTSDLVRSSTNPSHSDVFDEVWQRDHDLFSYTKPHTQHILVSGPGVPKWDLPSEAELESEPISIDQRIAPFLGVELGWEPFAMSTQQFLQTAILEQTQEGIDSKTTEVIAQLSRRARMAFGFHLNQHVKNKRFSKFLVLANRKGFTEMMKTLLSFQDHFPETVSDVLRKLSSAPKLSSLMGYLRSGILHIAKLNIANVSYPEKEKLRAKLEDNILDRWSAFVSGNDFYKGVAYHYVNRGLELPEILRSGKATEFDVMGFRTKKVLGPYLRQRLRSLFVLCRNLDEYLLVLEDINASVDGPWFEALSSKVRIQLLERAIAEEKGEKTGPYHPIPLDIVTRPNSIKREKRTAPQQSRKKKKRKSGTRRASKKSIRSSSVVAKPKNDSASTQFKAKNGLTEVNSAPNRGNEDFVEVPNHLAIESKEDPIISDRVKALTLVYELFPEADLMGGYSDGWVTTRYLINSVGGYSRRELRGFNYILETFGEESMRHLILNKSIRCSGPYQANLNLRNLCAAISFFENDAIQEEVLSQWFDIYSTSGNSFVRKNCDYYTGEILPLDGWIYEIMFAACLVQQGEGRVIWDPGRSRTARLTISAAKVNPDVIVIKHGVTYLYEVMSVRGKYQYKSEAYKARKDQQMRAYRRFIARDVFRHEFVLAIIGKEQEDMSAHYESLLGRIPFGVSYYDRETFFSPEA